MRGGRDSGPQPPLSSSASTSRASHVGFTRCEEGEYDSRARAASPSSSGDYGRGKTASAARSTSVTSASASAWSVKGGGGVDATAPRSLSLPDRPLPRSPRLAWWGGLCLSCLIAAGSAAEAVKIQRQNALSSDVLTSDAYQHWTVVTTTTAFLLSFAVLSVHAAPRLAPKIVGSKLELSLIVLMCGFTAAAVGSATDPARGLAANEHGGVGYGNLYYATWAGFGCSLGLLNAYVRMEKGVDVTGELRSRGRRFGCWCLSIVINLIVMAASASAYDARCFGAVTGVKATKYCNRSGLGVGVGCIGCVTSLALMAARLTLASTGSGEGDYEEGSAGVVGAGSGRNSRGKGNMFIAECTASIVLFCTYGFAVAYLTSEEGPGAPLGNLYYSSWIAFGLFFYAAANCLEEIHAARAMIISGRRRLAREFNIQLEEEEDPSSLPSQSGGIRSSELDSMMPSSPAAGSSDGRTEMMNPSASWYTPVDAPEQRRQPQELDGEWTHVDSNILRRSGSVGEVRIDMD